MLTSLKGHQVTIFFLSQVINFQKLAITFVMDIDPMKFMNIKNEEGDKKVSQVAGMFQWIKGEVVSIYRSES